MKKTSKRKIVPTQKCISHAYRMHAAAKKKKLKKQNKIKLY